MLGSPIQILKFKKMWGPKRPGKPRRREWTVLIGVGKTDTSPITYYAGDALQLSATVKWSELALLMKNKPESCTLNFGLPPGGIHLPYITNEELEKLMP